jgi:hypothetical protein
MKTVTNEFWFLVDRYYDPSTDQFLSVDPDVAETGQPYAFTDDNPLNERDPLGLQAAGVYPSSQTANGNPIEAIWVGNAGSIKYIAGADGTVHWIVTTKGDLYYGHYHVVVIVNGKKYDEKPHYEKGSVHGRVNAKFAQRGAVITILGSFIPAAGQPATTGWNYFIAPGKY